MPSEQDLVTDGINKPMLAVAGLLVVVGFILSITIALMPLGLVVMAVGAIWALALFLMAKAQAKTRSPDQ